ncbi:Ig-like domain-containing protein [Lachnospiraceae bacterium 46-15]
MLKGIKQMPKSVISMTLAGLVALTSLPVSAAPETVAGGYVIDMERLPKVHFSKHKDWETLYQTAWNSHKSNITAITKELNPELTTDNATSYYVDEAFDETIFQWDTLFMMMFDKYGIHEFPTLNSMDNFYYHQTDAEDDSDGYICRRINQSNGQLSYSNYLTVDAINPPMFAWAEWEQYQVHGDISRFTKKVKEKAIIDRLDAYWQFLKRTRTHKSGPAEGLYVSNGQGNGLDNTPNQDWYGWGQAANDMSIQQVQAANYIVKILDEMLAKDETLTEEDRTKYQGMKEKYQKEEADLKQLVQEKLWSEDGSFFFNMDAATGNFTNIATPTGLWALAAGVATKDQADRMIREYVLNSNKMFRPNGLATVCYDYSTFKPTGGYWNGAVWSPTSYQWLKGLQKYGYDELAFKEAVRHTNALADVCVNGAYDRYGNFLHTLWENYSSEYSIPGSTEHSDTEPSRSNFVGWAGALGIGAVIENLAGITINGNENAIEWDIKLTEEFGVDNLYFNGAEGENFVNLSCSERTSDTSGATLTVKADHDFELRVKVGGKSQTIQAKAGEHVYSIDGTDGNDTYLGIRTSKRTDVSFTANQIEAADSAVLFGEEGTSAQADGLPNQIEKGNKKIFNVNTVGYYRTNSKYPTNLRDSKMMQALGAANAKEYSKTTSPHGAEGFMFMVPASNTMQTAKALIGVKNGTAKVEADLMDASEVTKTAELKGAEEETVYAVEIPNCASKDTDMMVTVTMEQNGKEQGEISLKAIVLENGGSEVLEAPIQVNAESKNAALFVNASAPEGISYDSYRVYYKTAEDNSWNVKNTKTLPYKLEGLSNYKRYDVLVTGIKDGMESADSESVSEIPEEVKRTDAQRAYHDWLEVRKKVLNGNADFSNIVSNLNFDVKGPTYGTTFIFSSDSNLSKYGLRNNGNVANPLLPLSDAATVLKTEASCGEKTIKITIPAVVKAMAADTIPYVSGKKGELTSGTVNLTAEGTVDWAQFYSESTTDYIRKVQAEAKIKNFKVIDGVDGKISDGTFSFESADGTGTPVDHSGISARSLNDGFTMELPYSDKMQEAKFYANAWGGDVTLEIAVNNTVFYSGTFGKDDSSGMAGQEFVITYKAPSASDKVTAKLYCSKDLEQWGGCVTALQAVTIKETQESIPVPEAEDTQVVFGTHTAPESVSLTEEGTVDWNLFTVTNLGQIEKKAGGRGIANLSAIQAVTKLNPDSSETTFSFTDGTNNAAGDYSKGIVFEKTGNGIVFDLPYSARKQTVGIHLGAWSAKVKINASVVKEGRTLKEYAQFFDTGAQASAAPAKYGMISMEYLLNDADSVLHVEISNDTLYDETWGNFNLGAITLSGSFYASAEETENGSIFITNPIASPGETVTVFAAANAGYELAEGSLKYYTEENTNGTPVKDSEFIMPSEDVMIKAKFLKKVEIADKKELNAAIKQAENLSETNYTPESWAEFQKVLARVKATLNNKDASTEEVKTAEEELRAAFKLLVIKKSELPKPVQAASISIQAPSKKLAAGKKVKLTAFILPENTANKTVTWSVSNTKYATISQAGILTLKKAGIGKNVTVTAAAADGSKKTAVYKIKIMKRAVKSIKISAASKKIKAGKTLKLKAKITTTGKGTVNKTLKWSSSNTKYATVNKKGQVKTKKAGKGKTVTITAVSTDGSNKKAKIKLRIK